MDWLREILRGIGSCCMKVFSVVVEKSKQVVEWIIEKGKPVVEKIIEKGKEVVEWIIEKSKPVVIWIVEKFTILVKAIWKFACNVVRALWNKTIALLEDNCFADLTGQLVVSVAVSDGPFKQRVAIGCKNVLLQHFGAVRLAIQ